MMKIGIQTTRVHDAVCAALLIRGMPTIIHHSRFNSY